jgi:predicted Kef-type K+ transport protein
MPAEGQSLIVAGALLSIALNPLAFYATARFLPSRTSGHGLEPTTAATQVSESS